MKQAKLWVLGSAMICMASFHAASADELTAMVEKDLATLGYDVGNVDGEADVSTAIAISKYQAEKGMDVTGEVSPQLAGILAADVKKQGAAPAPSATAPVPTAGSQDSAAQQVCLQQKIAAAQQQQQAQKKKEGLGGMFSSLFKAASKYGNNDIAQISADIYEANATMNDLAEAARELGISESEISECEGTPAAGTATVASTTNPVSSAAETAAVASTTSAGSTGGGNAGGSVQYVPAFFFRHVAAIIGKSDGGLTQCNRGRPDYRQRFARMVTDAHPGYEAKALAIYDENFAAYELKPEVTCSDEQLAEMKKVTDETVEGALNGLVLK